MSLGNSFKSAPAEKQPALRSLSEASVRRIWLAVVVSSLVIAWCALDSWNHDMSSQLYQMNEVKDFSVDSSGKMSGEFQPFKYTLTLCFLQFAFMGFVYCSSFTLNAMSSDKSLRQSVAPLWSTVSDGRGTALVTSHIFGSVLLQSLMMPAQMMSLSLFAATRAVEVPVAAVARKHVFGARSSGPSKITTMLMFAAAWLLFFSYTQIAECLCVWSGFGVALSGVPLYCVYALVLTLPAVNTVLQESVLVQDQVNPLLMQGVQNLCATIIFVPILLAADWLGYEDVGHAFAMIMGHSEVYMTVLWLCVQTLVISAVTIGMILTMDSFWAVAARSLRVVFWWSRQLQLFYLTSSTLLSVARPHASVWSFVMLGGILLGFTAFVSDKREAEDDPEEKKLLNSSQFTSNDALTTGFGIGKYV